MKHIPSPVDFFGFEPGEDRHMIHWNDLCAYYRLLDSLSGRVKLVEAGKTTEGNDFLQLYISEKENIEQLEHYRQISMKMADPRGLRDEEIDALAREGRAVCMQNYSLHSNEVGGALAAPRIVYELITAVDGDRKRILENVIFIMTPCAEPDGQIVFTEWYNKWLGTEYEGCYSPHIRHKFAGHSNNRDAVNECVVESRYINDVLLRSWMPQVFQDHHHQCPRDPRMNLSVQSDPVYPSTSPLVQREEMLFGAEMACALTAAGCRGVVLGNDDRFPDYPISTFYGNAKLHNICGMLTENADAAIATPVVIDMDKRGGIVTANDPAPWPGGEWHLSDIVKQIQVASLALLAAVAKEPAAVLRRMAQKALLQTARGAASAEQYYLIPLSQHDMSARHRFLSLAAAQQVEMYSLAEERVIGGQVYQAGTVVIPLAQPKYAVVDMFCCKRPYPVSGFVKKDAYGMPVVDDDANVCLALAMGITAIAAGEEIALTSLVPYVQEDYVCSMRACENESYMQASRLLAAGQSVFRDEYGDFYQAEAPGRQRITRKRIGLLKMNKQDNEEEGFVRNLLHHGEFDYRILLQKELCEQGVPDDIAILIIAGEKYTKLVGGAQPPLGLLRNGYVTMPSEYYAGLGEMGDAALRAFVARGGRLVAWGETAVYLNEHLKLGITIPTWGKTTKEFHTGGSHLRVRYAPSAFTFGLPEESTVYHRDKVVFSIPQDIPCTVLAHYAQKDLLANGYLVGEEHIAGCAAALCMPIGMGEIVLFSFDPQYRLQQAVSMKILLNTLY
ncbi:MAG: hypothetical protein IJY20_00685 [Clostridia bacterium]|nr:hypothetical protein [Clostridia bacterium]